MRLEGGNVFAVPDLSDALVRNAEEVVAAHLVNLCWNGLLHLENDPPLLDE